MVRFPTRCSVTSLLRGGQKKGLQTDLQSDIVREIEALLGPQSIEDLDFEAVELAARRQALRLAARALEQRLNADTSDRSGPEQPCSCGEPAKYRGRHEKTFESVLGSLRLKRAYYHCAKCESGFCPRDRAFGLGLFSLTPGVLRMTGSTAALVSFEESAALLHELAGVEVSISQAQRAAEALGAEIAADERVSVEPIGDVAPAIYLGMDGTGVPMRPCEVAGRAGKQPDGSAKTREAKLVTVWTAESRDEEGKPTRDEGSATYSAAIQMPAPSDPTSPSACYGKPPGEAIARLRDVSCSAMARPGSGTPRRNCFPKASKSWTASTSKKTCIEPLNRSLAQPARRASNGQRRAARNSTMEGFRRLFTRSALMSAPTMKQRSLSCTSFATVTACAIQSFMRWAIALLPESWKPDAKSPSGPVSSGQACTGPSPEPTLSSLCAAVSSADVMRISLNAAGLSSRLPREPPASRK